MQNIKNLIIFLTLSPMIVGCNNKFEEPAIISVKWQKNMPEKICLYKTDNGELKEIASATEVDSVFYFAYKPSGEDIFYLGANKSPENRFAVYLKAGDRLDLTVTENSYRLNGTGNSKENKEMSKWHDFIHPLTKTDNLAKLKTSPDAPSLLKEKISTFKNYPESTTGNADFDRRFKTYKQFNFMDIAGIYFILLHTFTPEKAEFTDDFRIPDIADFTRTTDLLNYPSGVELIEKTALIKNLSETKNAKNSEIGFLDIFTGIQNDTLKGEYAIKHISSCRTYAEVMELMEPIEKYFVTEKQKNKVKDIINSHLAIKDGDAAFDFKFQDANGKEIALSDFKGKVVYIDVWATWCGPCVHELPYLKKLETDFHSNMDIVFMSVSIDETKDLEKWKGFIVKEEMKGIQLFAGSKARREIMNPYKIASIPRFMIVGKDGNIISLNAPRPSSEEIAPLLKSLLI